MAVVSLVVSRSETGVEVDDELAGGETGCDFGTVPNNGSSLAQTLYIRHNGNNPITDLSLYIQPYYGLYGGAFTASDDYNKLLDLGDDLGGEYGLQNDEDWNNPTPFSSFYKFKTGSGDTFATRRFIPTTSMIYRDPSTSAKSDPTSPVAGQLGPNDDSANAQALGNRAQLKMRLTLPASETEGGIRQWSTIIAYVYTS